MTVVDKSMDLGYSSKKTKIFLNWLGTNKIVLDLGCYDGRDSKKFIDQGNTVHGIEVLQKPAKKAEKLGIKVKNIDIEKQSWEYKPNTFDVVICGDIIEHVIDVDTFLTNIKDVLKSGGEVYISTPNLASIGRRLLLLLGKNPFIEVSNIDKVNGFPAVGHVRYFTKTSLTRLLNHHGFEVVKVTSDNINLGGFSSAKLAEMFPTFSWRLIVKAIK